MPVLLGSLARLPMGILTDRFGARGIFTALLVVSAAAAALVPLTTSYASLLAAAFFIGLAGSSFAIGAAFVARWTPAGRQGMALGIFGLGTLGQSLAVFGGPLTALALRAANRRVFHPADVEWRMALLLTATMNAFLGGDADVIWPAAAASLACFLLNAGLLWHLGRIERAR